LHHHEILATITIAHHFKSAFNREQLFRYLKSKIDKKTFHSAIDKLVREKIVFERNNLLFAEDIEEICHKKRSWSKALFKENIKYLWFLSKLPWIKYIGLTGANSFESCNEDDDIDLFIITSRDRLWICYLTIVLITKLIRKRQILCVNYLIDENNLEIAEKSYFTAVQIIQMMPVFDNGHHKKLIEENPWIFEILPNAKFNNNEDSFYLLKRVNNPNKEKTISLKVLSSVNRKIYKLYAERLERKFPKSFGKGILLSEGMAKLNRIDNHDIYQNLFKKIYEAMNP
jgi:hypothetical protein